MTLTEAIKFIDNKKITSESGQVWVDLGCGDGLFTRALQSLLPDKNHIYAVDQNKFEFDDKRVTFVQSDFNNLQLPVSSVNGIVMFNSLHFIKEKESLLRKLCLKLESDGIFILGEYDLSKANNWVPYPITFREAESIFRKIGFNGFDRIYEKQSSYNRSMIYSAVAWR